MPSPFFVISKVFDNFLDQNSWAVKIVHVVCRGVHFAPHLLVAASNSCARKGLETVETVFILRVVDEVSQRNLCAQLALYNIRIKNTFNFGGRKEASAWQ